VGNYSIWADDYGYRAEVNTKINLLLKEGKMMGYSVLATHVGDNILVNDSKNNTLVSLHTNLVEGTPVSDPAEVNSLVDRTGHFYPLWIFVARVFLGKIKTKDLRKEIEAQYKKLVNIGLNVSYIDSHQHVHSLGLVHNSVREIADKYNLTMRNYGDVKAFTVRAKLIFAFLKLVSYLTHPFCKLPEGWKKNDSSWFIMSWETVRFKKNINNMKNRNILVVHPGRSVDKCKIIDY
jgi:predicted glycoside hydrolase/deacetylase ChbG (UPF0249 family)